MNRLVIQQAKGIALALAVASVWACGSQKTVTTPDARGYQLTQIADERIEIDSRFDAHPNAKAVQLLDMYKWKVDSIMSPVIGESTHFMKAEAPESDLSNLVADALLWGGGRYVQEGADFSLTNFGGLRSSLPAGPVTFGNIFEITPFENTLVLIPIKGSDALRLFAQLCKIKDGCIAGAQIVSTADGRLKEARIGGKPVDENKVYTLATIDYLAEGNDGFQMLADIKNTIMPDGATLRQLFLDYVKEQTRQGKKLDARVEGRFIIEK